MLDVKLRIKWLKIIPRGEVKISLKFRIEALPDNLLMAILDIPNKD